MKDCKVRFIVTSDIHYKIDSDTEHTRFEKGMQMAYEYAKTQPYPEIDGFFAVGDFANSGNPAEMELFKASLDKTIADETTKILTMASHEFFFDGPESAYKNFDRIFGIAPDNHIVLNGFHFISLSCTKGCNFDDSKISFLEKALAEAAADDRKKPIFVFQHPHPQSTVYGSILWGETEFVPALMNYPQVIDFSGHSHAPINDPRSVHQKYFTSFGTGSFSYFELDEFDKITGTCPQDCHICAQYYIVEAYDDNSVRVIPVDVISGKFFNDGIWVEEPWNPDAFIYTDDRAYAEEAPVFGDDFNAEITYNDGKISISFTQAASADERTDSYTLKIRDCNGFIRSQKNVTSSYYIYDMPAVVTAEYECSLEKGTYEMELTANAFLGRKSIPMLIGFTVE